MYQHKDQRYYSNNYAGIALDAALRYSNLDKIDYAHNVNR